MELRVSLLEILALAEKNREAAAKKARHVIIPYNSEKFSPYFVGSNYYQDVAFPYEQLRTMPAPQFIFDTYSHFFIHHRDGQLTSFGGDKTVLHNQPDEGLTSIVIGRLPVWRRKDGYSLIYFDHGYAKYEHTTADRLVYLYLESGSTRKPHFSVDAIRGEVRLSENRPFLYASVPFREDAPIIARTGFHEEIGLVVPRGLKPRQYQPPNQGRNNKS